MNVRFRCAVDSAQETLCAFAAAPQAPTSTSTSTSTSSEAEAEAEVEWAYSKRQHWNWAVALELAARQKLDKSAPHKAVQMFAAGQN